MTQGIDASSRCFSSFIHQLPDDDVAAHRECIKRVAYLDLEIADKSRMNYWLGFGLLVAIPFIALGIFAIVCCVFVPVGISP